MSDYVEKQVTKATTTLRLMTNEGSNLSLPRHVVYFFFGRDLQRISLELRDRGFGVHRSGDEGFWHLNERQRSLEEAGNDIGWMAKVDWVVADRIEVTDEEWRSATLRSLYELAEQHEVTMDGWHAELD